MRPTVLIAILLCLRALPALAQAPVSPSPATVPFDVEIPDSNRPVRASAEKSSPQIGWLHAKVRETIVACVPSCDAPDAWGVLAEGGAISLQGTVRAAPLEGALPALPVHWHGVERGSVAVREEPQRAAKILRHEPPGRVLAFLPDEALLAKGWLQRPQSGFVASSDIRLDVPSVFQGVRDPALPLAITVRALKLRGAEQGTVALPKYARFPVTRATSSALLTSAGPLPRTSARLAVLHERPTGIPASAKWVDVDLREQVLVAYDGDHPVYATLISSGKRDHETPQGLFRVTSKVRSLRMHGDDYYVEEVPWALFFHNGVALHGTFWHDVFGNVASHGCVNLSMADAEWLFRWAPPSLPPTWKGRYPAAGDETLWVNVRRRPQVTFQGNPPVAVLGEPSAP